MAKSGYVQIGIPNELHAEITRLIEEHEEMGYKTVPEFVKEAIRNWIVQVSQREEGKE